MTNKILTTLIALFLILGCKTKKAITESVENSSTRKENVETIGHLKMSLIDYEVIDTSIANVEMAEMMIKMMKPSMESELVFNSHKSAELVNINDESGYTRRFLYERLNKKAFQFLSSGAENYYSEMNIEEMMSDIETPTEELAEMDKMFKLKKYTESGLEILGFKCDEVTMMQPDDYSKVYSIVYTTDKIPHLSEAMGPMSKYFTGAPIKTVMFVNGLKITIGAIEYVENPSMKEYLEFNPDNYKKLTIEQFEEMKNN
ncbi:MAG: hypothetical protein GY705_15900 [Bacteroidetes bacterium]|nr:hypothetical protein [Bacteroidota bacterium]